jgi:DNA polymerase III sliding clamp (beta) subunit (PCNA family)
MVKLHATDLDSFISFTVDGKQPGASTDVVIPNEHLTKAAKGSLPKESITITPEDKSKARIKRTVGGTMIEQAVTTVSPEEWPSIPRIKAPGIQVEAGFAKAFKEALELTSEDSSRYILQGACLDVADKKLHYIVGTNGRALYSANSFAFPFKKSIIIPDSKFLSHSDLLDEEPLVSVEPGQEAEEAKGGQPAKEATPGWVRFETSRWSFTTKEILGQYPNWKQVLPDVTSKWTRIELSQEAIREMLLIIPNLPGADNPNKTIKLSADQHVVISARNNDAEEWTNIPVTSVVIQGDSVVTCLNRDYLLKALRFGLSQMHIEDELTPILFSDKKRKMVVMPVREGDPKAQPDESTPPTPAQTQTPPHPVEVEERKEMPRVSKLSETPRVVTNSDDTNASNGHQNGASNGSAYKSIAERVDQVKESLKGVLRELGTIADSLKQAEKEKRTSEKEIENIRSKLRQIQNVAI